MKLKIQRWGNSAAIRLNKGLLNQLDVEIGMSLDAEVSAGVLHLEPAEPAYTMDDLLVGCTRENMQLDDEDSQWLNAIHVGREFR